VLHFPSRDIRVTCHASASPVSYAGLAQQPRGPAARMDQAALRASATRPNARVLQLLSRFPQVVRIGFSSRGTQRSIHRVRRTLAPIFVHIFLCRCTPPSQLPPVCHAVNHDGGLDRVSTHDGAVHAIGREPVQLPCWIMFCRGCEVAHDWDKAAVAACGGDDAGVAKNMVMPVADTLPGRWDRMSPNFNKCRFANLSLLYSVPARVAECCPMGGNMPACTRHGRKTVGTHLWPRSRDLCPWAQTEQRDESTSAIPSDNATGFR